MTKEKIVWKPGIGFVIESHEKNEDRSERDTLTEQP